MKIRIGAVFATAGWLVLSGCAWRGSTITAEQVRVVTAEQLQGCTNKGATHVSVVDRRAVLARTEGGVEHELVRLARQSAAQLGGNAIVEMTNVNDGTQSFAVFHCR